jgi:hypothetical protein
MLSFFLFDKYRIIIKSEKHYSSIEGLYRRKHLGRRREKNKKIMKTKLPRSYKCSCPSKKRKKEKRLELR